MGNELWLAVLEESKTIPLEIGDGLSTLVKDVDVEIDQGDRLPLANTQGRRLKGRVGSSSQIIHHPGLKPVGLKVFPCVPHELVGRFL